jgi:diguanylate cyclase (GGDEF)-like protein/PAS domain S-box-containing protein
MEKPTHRQIEQQLREKTLSEERFRLVASHIDEAFWLSCPDEREIYYVSPTYETIVGRSCDSLYADPASWIESLHPDDAQRVREAMGTCSPDLNHDGEYRLATPDDTHRWVRIRSVPIIDKGNRIVARAFFATDVTERRELRSAALHDKLTRLPNRSLLSERLTKAIERSKEDPHYKFAVLFLDFDRFKIINDSLGHEVGDLLLISIAERLTANISEPGEASGSSEGHVAARLGGDEFVILLDDVRDTSDATTMADRLQTALSAAHSIRGHDVISTASIGIVNCAGEYDRAQDIIRDADTAMYHAKSTGKARHVVFDERMHLEAVQRLELEEDLRRALHRQEFRLAYQPIIDLESGRLTGFEALLRWNHPVRGDVPPGMFIGLTEEIGLIVPLGAWVVREAATQLKKWHDQVPQDPPLEMNINLSRRQLDQDDLIGTLRRIIDETGVNPESLKLEVTESAMMESPERVTDLLNELKGLGVKLCMDDFGTGYSSLSCLHHFPIDVLKIDRTFILNTDNNREYAAVIHAIITLAHTLKMTVVGEGVESGGQLAQLQALECDAAQGNFFSKPLSVTAAEAYMRGPKGLAKSA